MKCIMNLGKCTQSKLNGIRYNSHENSVISYFYDCIHKLVKDNGENFSANYHRRFIDYLSIQGN